MEKAVNRQWLSLCLLQALKTLDYQIFTVTLATKIGSTASLQVLSLRYRKTWLLSIVR